MSTTRTWESLILPGLKDMPADQKKNIIKSIAVYLREGKNEPAAPVISLSASASSPASSSLSLSALPLQLVNENHFSQSTGEPIPSSPLPLNPEQALLQANLGEELLMLVKGLNQKSRLRKHDMEFNRSSKSYLILRSNRFNVAYQQLISLRLKFVHNQMSTALIEEAEAICRRTQRLTLDAHEAKGDSFAEITSAMVSLTLRTEAFCASLDKNYIDAGLYHTNPAEVVIAHFDSALYDLYEGFYLYAVAALREQRYEDLTAFTFEFLESCDKLVLRNEMLVITDKKLEGTLDANNIEKNSRLRRIASNFFTTTAKYVSTNQMHDLVQYVLNIQPGVDAGVNSGRVPPAPPLYDYEFVDGNEEKKEKEGKRDDDDNRFSSSLDFGMTRRG